MTRKYFGTDGIRGTVGQAPITPDFVLRLAHAVGRVLKKTPSLLVFNRVPARAKLTGTVLEAFNALDVPLAKSRIGNRVALAAAINEGQGILEYEPSSAAAREIKALADEVLQRCAA